MTCARRPARALATEPADGPLPVDAPSPPPRHLTSLHRPLPRLAARHRWSARSSSRPTPTPEHRPPNVCAQVPDAPPPPPTACVPLAWLVDECFGASAGSDDAMDIEEAQRADARLALFAERGDPACFWPRSQPTACFAAALSSSSDEKLASTTFSDFVSCRVASAPVACARVLCENT